MEAGSSEEEENSSEEEDEDMPPPGLKQIIRFSSYLRQTKNNAKPKVFEARSIKTFKQIKQACHMFSSECDSVFVQPSVKLLTHIESD
jgi:hypothetical protein